jgi:3-hydroxybutyryl-CoA dehydrogenase
MLVEAIYVLQEGGASREDIDQAMKLGLGHPMGPLTLAGLIGLDTLLAICEVYYREFGDPKYRPPILLRRYVTAGWLGRKSGKGFYAYAPPSS